MLTRTCGQCVHLDPRPIPVSRPIPIFRCERRCTLEWAETPRGEPGELACKYWERRP